MKSLFCRITKKALSLMLLIIVLIGCSSQILAAYTDNIKVGDTLKFTGTSWSIYKTESSARTLDSSKVKRYLNKNNTITIKFKSGNVLKIGDNEYIYYGSTASKYFSKVSSTSTSTNTTNTSTINSNTNITNTSNTNTTNTTNTKPNQNNNSNNFMSISNIRERTRNRLSSLKSLLSLFSRNESHNKTNVTTPSISAITIPSDAGPGYKFHYNNLSDKEKKVYRYMYSKKSDLINGIQINLEPLSNTLDGLTSDEFLKAMRALEYDHPEFYYITSQNKYVIAGTSKHLTKMIFKDVNTSLKQNFDKIDSIANTLVSDVKNKSDYEKLKYLHDWIAKNLTYKTNVSLSLDGFITKQGQCMTYALMYKYLLNKLNIDCIYVSGYVTNEGYHAWNQVKLNGKWYGVDVCWDDPTGGSLRYTYFLKGKNSFKNRTLDYSYPALNNSNY